MKFSPAAILLLPVLSSAICDDDYTKKVFVEATGKDEPCVWLAARMDEFGDLCEGEFGTVCPETCGNCSDEYFCKDSGLYFDYKGIPRSCLWLSLRSWVRAEEGVCEPGTPSAEACPETCEICEVEDSPGYGYLEVMKDETTGLPLLALPKGFRYMSYGWVGQTMTDGNPTPTDHDGMAVVKKVGNLVYMIRNHELGSVTEGPPLDKCGPNDSTDCVFNPGAIGGTTTLVFDLEQEKFVEHYASLGGTIRNCAGGLTPWGSWLSLEETFSERDGVSHGWVFDVPYDGPANGEPVKAAGRFNGEAAAVDPLTGVVYQTEDRGMSVIWKYVAPNTGDADWVPGTCERDDGSTYDCLADGGDVYYMVVTNDFAPDFVPTSNWEKANMPNATGKDMRGGFENGARFNVEWKLMPDPEGLEGYPTQTGGGIDGAWFERGEGAWWDDGKLFFIATSGGAANAGQIWKYDPVVEVVEMFYESPSYDTVWAPDNIATRPFTGAHLLCEDGGTNPKRLVGLTDDLDTFGFAENRVRLSLDDIATVDKVFPGVAEGFYDTVISDAQKEEVCSAIWATPTCSAGDATEIAICQEQCDAIVNSFKRSFESREWAGATFSDDWLFVNIQSPGITFAITGPWESGGFIAEE